MAKRPSGGGWHPFWTAGLIHPSPLDDFAFLSSQGLEFDLAHLAPTSIKPAENHIIENPTKRVFSYGGNTHVKTHDGLGIGKAAVVRDVQGLGDDGGSAMRARERGLRLMEFGAWRPLTADQAPALMRVTCPRYRASDARTTCYLHNTLRPSSVDVGHKLLLLQKVLASEQPRKAIPPITTQLVAPSRSPSHHIHMATSPRPQTSPNADGAARAHGGKAASTSLGTPLEVKAASLSLALSRALPTSPRPLRRVSTRERVVWAGVAAGGGGGDGGGDVRG